MRLRMISGWLTGLAVLASLNVARAQDYPWADQMFEKLEHDFGVVATGADMKYRLKITNKYQQKVHIVGISTSCVCTAAKPARDTLASGESEFIEITMNSRKVQGAKEIRLTVTFDQPSFAQSVIKVKAFVSPDVILNPGEAAFGTVYKGTETTRRLALAYNGKGRSAITNLICKNPNLAAKLVPVRQEGTVAHHELHVTLKPSAPLGELRDQLVIITDDPANPHIPVLIEAQVEEEYSVSPTLVPFGNLAPGERKTVNIVVRGKDPFTIEKIESEKSAGTFEVRLTKGASKTHVLPLTLIAPAESGPITEEFTLTISGRAEPITFKAIGKIAGRTSAASARGTTR